MVSSQRQATGALVRGMREADLKTLPSVNNAKLRARSRASTNRAASPSAGASAWKHGVALGDKLTLISPEGPETVMGTAPAHPRPITVVAIFDIGMSDYDDGWSTCLAEAQEYFVQEDGATAIEVMVDNPDAVEERIAAHEGQDHGPAVPVTGGAPTRPSSMPCRSSAT